MAVAGLGIILIGLRLEALAQQIQIRGHGRTVDVDASRAEAADLLDALARETAMVVTYRGSRPRQIVDLHLKAREPLEVVAAVLRPLGIGFAFTAHENGEGVAMLLVGSGQSSSGRPDPRPDFPALAEPGPSVSAPPALRESDPVGPEIEALRPGVVPVGRIPLYFSPTDRRPTK